jgi:hypothetical protein
MGLLEGSRLDKTTQQDIQHTLCDQIDVHSQQDTQYIP